MTPYHSLVNLTGNIEVVLSYGFSASENFSLMSIF